LDRQTSQKSVLRENLIRPVIVDFLILGCGPWDDDFMAPVGPSDPPWHGSIPVGGQNSICSQIIDVLEKHEDESPVARIHLAVTQTAPVICLDGFSRSAG
jgi:hypothetical protein